jgi:DNA-binding NtrC family response regulator
MEVGRMGENQAIICVDDEAIILLALKNELRRRLPGRFHVETALDAESAIELIERLEGDGVKVVLILSDWLMPGTKGDEFIERVKRERPDIRCILVSGQADAMTIAQNKLQALLDAFVAKPWQSESLIRTVMGCLESDREPSGV